MMFFQLPPLVIKGEGQVTVCNNRYKIHDWLTPDNLERCYGFVLYDPCGYLRQRYAGIFKRSGYIVKTFDTDNLKGSNKYNPLRYAEKPKAVQKIVASVISGTDNFCESGDIRFLAAETALLTALIGYAAAEAPQNERHMLTVVEMLKHMGSFDFRSRYNDSDFKHAIDRLFEELAKRKPCSPWVGEYDEFKRLADYQGNHVVDSCVLHLKHFDAEDAKACFGEDELGLSCLSLQGKTALFVSAGYSSNYDFLVPLLYTQLFDNL